jgi:hypothetical protein
MHDGFNSVIKGRELEGCEIEMKWLIVEDGGGDAADSGCLIADA